MFRSPFKGAESTHQHETPKKVPLKGFFADGIWHCNCKPRLPASRFQVRKEGPNKGRWFYTCQKPKGDGCDFFLWEDKAKGREREVKVILDDKHSELDSRLRTPSKKGPGKRTIEEYHEIGKTSPAKSGGQDDDEFGSFPLTSDDVNEIVDVAERQLRTPQKAIKANQYATPGGIKRQDEISALPTPKTNTRDEDIFTTPTTKRKTNMFERTESFGLQTPSKTPSKTPNFNRSFDSMNSDRSEIPLNSYDITNEVMDLLKDQVIDEETSSNLRNLLGKYALRTSGIARGRDISRLALKNKDVKIAELQERIRELETEREMDKTIIRHFKSDMASSIANRGNRGRGKRQS
ncbi:hypothetical protein F5884DRAFT_849600 [Xylogone sp. PMI_703]|nr:hypothetical protein F5884DRAFT_849600 [Xylogone sp. PMI_703]